jgi:TonB-linked SusC/RagA family outer membrane protein
MKRLFFILISIGFFSLAFGQSITLQGIVSSSEGDILPGVNIKVKGTPSGAITDINGKFLLKAKMGDILEFSFIGYKKQDITVRNKTNLNVILVPDENNLDEVVVVGYGKAKRITLTGAVSAVSAREIRNVPTSSVQNALSGKLPGFFSQQRSGQPGKDASDFFIRGVSSLNSSGNQPLIIVDDVQYTYDQLQQINVNEIESISILKDASTTAIYGIKGANGVLVVKTRRGEEGKPQINVRVEGGLQMPVRTPKFLDSYNTAILVNEAYDNDDISRKFSKADIMAFKDGSDPYGHPNVNWYDVIFKKIASQKNANVDISGGSKRLKYFVSAGYFTQNGLIKDFSNNIDDLNTNYFYRRFDYRSNLDFQVTDNLSMRLDLTSRFMNINQPFGMNAVGEIYNFSSVHPYSAPVLNPNGSWAYLYDTDGNNPTLNARLANDGYTRTRRNDNNILYGATWKMDFLTKGLAANFRLAYATIDENYRQAFRLNTFPTYHYDSSTNSYNINPNKYYAYATYTVNSGTNTAIKDLNLQASLNYARVFNKVHDVSLMFLYNRQNRTEEHTASVPAKFEGYTATISYKYKNKYLIDFNGAYNGTDRFGKNNRFGFFPAVGVGYVISEEPFFRDHVKDVQLFKIRASYGIVGSDVTSGNRYLYQQVYNQGGGYYFGVIPQAFNTYYEGSLGNDHVTWEKAKKFDIGIDLNLFDKLSITVDYFHDKRYDQLVTRNDLPSVLGIGVSPTNVARTTNKGFDGQISYQTRIGKVDLNTNFVFSYAKNKIDYEAEAQQLYPWLEATGKPIGQTFGYHYIGFYTPEDITKIKAGAEDAPAVPNTDIPVQAGDLKYQDLNKDGVINDYDKRAIGKPNLPNTTLGWTIGGFWNGFSFSVLFQGSFNYSFSVIGTGIESFKSQFQPIHTRRWTLERYEAGADIEFPRLTSNPSTINSAGAYMSDFWLINAWYIRVKTIDLGYQLPKKTLPKFLDNVRFYMNAYNLFTFTNYNKYQQDPEISTNTAGDAYMNQRVLNFGVQLTF